MSVIVRASGDREGKQGRLDMKQKQYFQGKRRKAGSMKRTKQPFDKLLQTYTCLTLPRAFSILFVLHISFTPRDRTDDKLTKFHDLPRDGAEPEAASVLFSIKRFSPRSLSCKAANANNPIPNQSAARVGPVSCDCLSTHQTG